MKPRAERSGVPPFRVDPAAALPAADLRPSTKARDRAYLNSLVLPRFGTTPLAAIRQPDVQAWVTQLTAQGFAPATVVKAYQLLGRTLTAAVNADMIPRSPCRAVRLPKIEREEMRFLNPVEVARLAEAIGSRYRALVLLGAYGGLRMGELATHMGPVGPADAHVFTAEKGGVLRTSNFRIKVWLPAVRSAAWRRCAHTTFATRRWRCGLRRAPTPRRSASGRATPPSALRWTATATCSQAMTPSCATAWTPCTPRACNNRSVVPSWTGPMVCPETFSIRDVLGRNSVLAAVMPFVTISGRCWGGPLPGRGSGHSTRRRRGSAVRKRSTWVAWAMLAIFGAGLILNVALAVANNSVARDPAGVLHLLDFTAFMVVGAVIVARRPDNAMGWLFSAVGLLALTLSLANEYTQYAYVTRPGALPGAIVAAWVGGWGPSPCLVSRSPSPCCCSPPVGCCRPAGDQSPGWPASTWPRSPCWPPSSRRSQSGMRGVRLPTRSGSVGCPTLSGA